MAGFISLLNTAGFALMLWSPHNYYTDILAMIIFGATIGALTCFLGGLIAVDISSRKAAGAALGTIGIASYAGAGRASFSPGSLLIKRLSLKTAKRCMISARWRCSGWVPVWVPRYSVLPLPPSSPGAMPSNGRPRSPHNRLTNKEEDMMPARHQGLLRLFIACALPLLALQSAAAADWQLEKVVELSRHGIRPPTAGNRKPSRPPPADRGPSGPPMTGSSPAMAMPPWSTKGVRKASITASSACCRPDARRRSRYTCAPARCSGRERPPRRWWMAPSPAAASLSIMSAGMPIPCFRPTSSPPRKPTPPASWRR